MNAKPTVFIVDDDYAVRDSFSMLFETLGIAVECFPSAEEFLEVYDPERPGCLVLDVNMPGMRGIELHEELIRRGNHIPIIFLTAHGDIPMTVRAIKAGAIDFLTKPIQAKQLIDHVKRAFVHDAELHEQAMQEKARCARLSVLSPREYEVMMLAVTGFSNKDIARKLGISYRTVEIHRSRVLEKTGTHSFLELAHLANPEAVQAHPS